MAPACYQAVMIKALETAISKIRSLPEDKQLLAAELLEEVAAAEEPYVLSPAERAILEPALQRARSGDVASDADVAATWTKCGL